ncbi:MAG: CNP1-like family protein [Burkholderiales bacterium]
MTSAGPIATAQEPKDTGAAATTFDTAPWQEQRVTLPLYPKEERLIRFDTGPASTLRFFVDRDSLSVGEDGVVRFTLVAKSDEATNVSYEGIRCSMRERKVYAYGQPDGAWREARAAQWVRIGPPVTDLHRFVLWDDYFCPGRAPIRTANEGVDALRLGGHPRAREFQSDYPVAR